MTNGELRETRKQFFSKMEQKLQERYPKEEDRMFYYHSSEDRIVLSHALYWTMTQLQFFKSKMRKEKFFLLLRLYEEEMLMLVLVKFSWYNQQISSFIDADHVYYRSLARRTFCGYLNDSTPMNTIEPRFSGKETVDEVSRHLAGIIFIDDNSIKEDSYSCNVILNPNALNNHSTAYHYLMSLVEKGDKRGLYDDLRYDIIKR